MQTRAGYEGPGGPRRRKEQTLYGHRARIGYTSPPVLTEVFPYEFYRIAPEGVTLLVTTLTVKNATSEELQDSYDISLAAAREMGKAGVDLVVLGGVPINLCRGVDKVDELIKSTEEDCGVPVTTSVTAQLNAPPPPWSQQARPGEYRSSVYP